MNQPAGPADFQDLPVRRFVEAVGEKSSTPGGGSVAGVVGSLSAALGEMCLNFSRGKKAFADRADDHERLAARLDRARALFDRLTADDAEAFRLYQDSAAGDGDVQLALSVATNVPRELTKLALAVLNDLAELAEVCTRHLLSDLMGAAALAVATARLSHYCVLVNARVLDDADAAAQVAAASQSDVADAERRLAAIEHAAQRKLAR